MPGTFSKRLRDVHAVPAPDRRDPVVDDIRRKTHHLLIEELGPVLQNDHLSTKELRFKVRDQLQEALGRGRSQLSPSEREQLIDDVTDDIVGYGPVDRYLHDATVTEVMVNGPAQVFVERNGKLERVPDSFVDEQHLRRIIDKIVSHVGRRIDESTPMVDARLPDGSRVNAVVHPLAFAGPFLTIRKFSPDPYRLEDLLAFGTLTPAAATFLEACVAGRLNIVVSGGTGSGKTTTLNVLSSAIGADERTIVIEDAKEIQLNQEHVLSLEARPSNVEGRGEVTIRDLVHNALRMRPDRIIVGEVRGGETLDMLQAMNTGHDGSLTTVHANTPRDALSRIETMALMAGFELPIRAIRDQMASALDVIVQMARLRDGTRRVTHITEVLGLKDEAITLQDVFLFDHGPGVDANGRVRGNVRPVGRYPEVAGKLEQHGIVLDRALFRPPNADGSPRPSKTR